MFPLTPPDSIMPFPRFVSAGEALTDFIRIRDHNWVSRAGGAPWNVARVVATLGVGSAFAGSVSKDRFGDELARLSSDASLDTRFLQRFDAPPLLAMVHETDPPRYFFVGAQSADLRFDPSQLPEGWMQHVEWVHCGGISLAREPLASRLVDMLNQVKRAGKQISFDPNFRNVMGTEYRRTLERVAPLADLIKVSDEDLHGLFGTADRQSGLAALRALNPHAPILLTLGALGAEMVVGRDTYTMAAPKVKVADTVGAGDASIGGLLVSLMTQPYQDWTAHLRFAVAAAGAACLKPGAAPPSLATVTQVMQGM
jgi:fructokinase